MKLRRMDFKERRHLDKRVLRAFMVAFVFVCCSAIIGITVANSNVTLARSSTKIEPSHLENPKTFPGSWGGFLDGLTDYDRIRYWEGGTRGDVDYNGNIAHWQAIPPEYSAGRIISENPNEDKNKGKEAYCPVENYRYSWSETVNGESRLKSRSWMDTNADKYKAWCRYSGNLSGNKTSVTGQWTNAAELRVNQTKDLRAWADYYDGAAYGDEFYDMRIYEWSSFKSAIMAYEGHGPSMAAVDFIVPIFATTMYEFHFYPKGTLKPLQDLIYKGPRPSPSNMKAEGQDSWQKGYNLYYNLAYLRTIIDKNTGKPYLSECNDSSCRKDVCLKTPSQWYKPRDDVEKYPQSYRGKIQCYSDSAAYRDEAGNIIYSGVYGHFEDGYKPKYDAESWGTASYQNAKHFIVDYTAKEYEEYLIEKEKSINPLHPNKEDPAAAETLGVFKGSLHINQWLTSGPLISVLGGGTVKKNPDGTVSKQTDVNVYTSHDSTYYISNTWDKMQYGWFKKNMRNVYCPDNSSICNYHWSTKKGGPDYDPLHGGPGSNSELWMTFTSSYENPFTIAWDWGMCAHADINEDTYTVAYVFDGDVESLPDDYPEIYKQMKEFNDEYKRVYKQPLENDPFFKSGSPGENINPKMVYKLFRVAKYGDYDPYMVNNSFPEDSGIDKEEFGWYNCETMEDDCLIPNDNPDHTGGPQERNGIEYNNGYDFIDGDRIYYGCLDCSLATYFPNTCYSNTNEPDTIKDYPDGRDVINEKGETVHIDPMGDKVEKEQP